MNAAAPTSNPIITFGIPAPPPHPPSGSKRRLIASQTGSKKKQGRWRLEAHQVTHGELGRRRTASESPLKAVPEAKREDVGGVTTDLGAEEDVRPSHKGLDVVSPKVVDVIFF